MARQQAQSRVREIQSSVAGPGPGRGPQLQLALYKNDLAAIEQALGRRVSAERELPLAAGDREAATWVRDAESDIRSLVDEEFTWLEERARDWANRFGAGPADFERIFRSQIYQDRARILGFFLREISILESERRIAAETQVAGAERAAASADPFARLLGEANPDPGECDTVTGLYDRRILNADLPLAVAAAGREGLPVSCLVLDLDNFKSINELHGHDKGDEVLRGVADQLRAAARGKGKAYRWGAGDELVVLLPNHTTAEGLAVAERIRAAVASQKYEGIPRAMTVSIGLATYPIVADDHDQLRARADDALRMAKEAGKNRTFVYRLPTGRGEEPPGRRQPG